MRAAAADLDFEEAARLRDEIKRLRTTELAVLDDPTARETPRGGDRARPHKPDLDEMGIATWHEVRPDRPGKRKGPHRSNFDSRGPGVESVPTKAEGPRSTSGKPGQRGG